MKSRNATWRDPLTHGLLCVGVVTGGAGAAYPTTLLGEKHAPGPIAGVLLGMSGALYSGVLWAVVTGVLLASARGTADQRAVAHAHGWSPPTARAAELRSAIPFLGIAAIGGMLGGIVSALAQTNGLADAPSLLALSPSPRTIAVAVLTSVTALLVGYLAGMSTRQPATAFLVYGSVLVGSAALIGGAYFSPALAGMASITPGGILIVLGRSELAAPQFTSQLSATTAAVSACFWMLVLLAAGYRRLSKGVSS